MTNSTNTRGATLATTVSSDASSMALLSYRGPNIDKVTGKVSAAGGVSSGLSMIRKNENAGWYYFEGLNFCYLPPNSDSPVVLGTFTQEEIDLHYWYCNRVLWAMKHSLSKKIKFFSRERKAYVKLQRVVTDLIVGNEKRGNVIFVHDYQFCLMSPMLQEEGLVCLYFNHIPETKEVPDLYKELQTEVVRGVLGAKVIGFHTTTYADDFLTYVADNIPGCRVHRDNREIFVDDDLIPTKVIVAPLGIDTGNWARMGMADYEVPAHLQGKKVFLAVARNDYTKGLPAMLQAWREFQKLDPEVAKGCILHIIGTKTREHIEAFKAEQVLIQSEYDLCEKEFPGTVHWQQTLLPPEELAGLYAHTDVLLIPAPVDGFNLTASEFIAAQRPGSGAVVCLSRGAGAYEVFGDLCTELVPTDPARMAIAYRTAANDVGTSYAKGRMELLKERVPTIGKWWRTFKTLAGEYLKFLSKAA